MKEETKDFQKEDAEVKKPVTLLERTLKYKGSVLEVYDDYVDVGGHKTHWDFIHHMGAAAVLPVLANGKILMVKQFRHALNRYTLEIPAGKRDSEDEDFLLCAKRELQEETGFYVAKDLQKGEQHFDVDEEIFLEEWELSDLQELIFAGKLTDGKTVAAIQSYAVKLQKEKQ